mmetsp:Transcript_16394/g.14319  ORF Transcript_16394/g.14319 Transcript_16394/m.14319 type:complete len:87 (+) Transcript_16394:339-599(+)
MSANGRTSTIDPINPERKLTGSKKLDFGNPKLFRKINGISEFNQITHAFNANVNKDYLKAFEKKRSFGRSKGMCSEFAKLSKSQPR